MLIQEPIQNLKLPRLGVMKMILTDDQLLILLMLLDLCKSEKIQGMLKSLALTMMIHLVMEKINLVSFDRQQPTEPRTLKFDGADNGSLAKEH